MNRLIITFLLTIVSSLLLKAQLDETLEIQAEMVDKNSNSEIQQFYKKLNLYVESIGKNSPNLNLPEELMIKNFIIFSEDGLIMKDLNFHSVESCKKQILESLPKHEVNKTHAKWIYVDLESHVNKRELIDILKFLKEHKIEYQFGEDEIIEKLINK